MEKYNYFLKFLKRNPQYGGQETNIQAYKRINIYTTAIIMWGILMVQ